VSTELEGVLRRIKKCLALSGSPNPHEAATALSMAQKLMAAHNITEAALQDDDITESEVDSTALNNIPGWEHMLSHGLCRIFGVRSFVRTGWCHWADRRSHQLARFVYVGANGSAETAIYAHTVVRRAVLKAKAAYMAAQPMAFWSRGEKISHSNSFCVAFVTEAFDSIADLKPSDGVAEALRLRLNAHLGDNPEMVRASRVKLRDAALAAGAEAGSAFKLYAGIPGVEAAKQLSHAPT
jgi:hypothetical protein